MARRLLSLVIACACALPARADEGVPLRLDRRLAPPPPRVDRDAVRFLSAERISGDPSTTVTATGDVSMRQRGAAISADVLEYTPETDTVVATGNVRLERESDTATGPRLVFRVSDGTGEMEQPVFTIPKREDRRFAARGTALRAVIEAEDINRLYQAQYTTCPVPRDDWTLKVSELEIDGKSQIGTAYNSAVYFLGVPILYSPWMSFPTNNARKTGFLAPTFGSSGRSGFEFMLPWYLNIADDQDLTITPKLFSKRGMQVAGEYRYLRPTYSGQADVEFLPHDAITDSDRSFLGIKHAQQLPHGWSLAVNAQRVSDNNYFRDLSTRVASTSQTNLPRDAILGYNDDIWAMSIRAIAYQTLQDAAAPIVPPYRQVPQFVVTGLKQGVYGADWQVTGELTNYLHPQLVNGQRMIVYPQVSLPLRWAWGYATPKIGYHFTRYNLSPVDGTPASEITRSLPLASVDTGLFFDRPWDFRGSPYLQTLEPRLFFVRVPYRDQSQIPNFSTAQTDFGIGSLFRENRFIGGDRIGDAEQLTVSITSRLVESDTGLERLKATLGQIYYFEPQRVTLTGPPPEGNRSDLVALVSGQVSPTLAVEGNMEYSASQNRAQRLNLIGRYNPQPGSIINAAYRFTRGDIKQVDFSAQWPLTAGITAVGRWNWSLSDRKLVEGLAGIEYNAGCWEIRAVAHRFITSTQQVSTSFQVQLELSGLSRIGINPLETLKQNISGYRRSDEIPQ